MSGADAGKMSEITLSTPANMIPFWRHIWGGEYRLVPPQPRKPILRVLDIGACVGAYARWALTEYPGCSVDCYEPNPDALEFLRKNCVDGMTIHPVAVATAVESGSSLELEYPSNNIGAATVVSGMVDAGDSVRHAVTGIPAASLPECDLMKLDCEGSEFLILEEYIRCTIEMPNYIVLEYHSVEISLSIQKLLSDNGYRITEMSAAPWAKDGGVGTQKWEHVSVYGE